MSIEVNFVSRDNWRSRGAPKVEIPAELQDWMEKTHRDGSACELLVGSEAKAEALVKLLRLYARSRDLSLRSQMFRRDGAPWVRFYMDTKRPYAKPTAGRERR